jgi:hypothetical protein
MKTEYTFVLGISKTNEVVNPLRSTMTSIENCDYIIAGVPCKAVDPTVLKKLLSESVNGDKPIIRMGNTMLTFIVVADIYKQHGLKLPLTPGKHLAPFARWRNYLVQKSEERWDLSA